MTNNYGIARVLEPKQVLPTSAWKLDNSRYLMEGEMRIDVRRIHLEGTSFKEICLEANDNDQRIRQKIMDIVIRRGKLHNPVTDTGGLLYGTVSEIADEYDNQKGFRPGEEVICNASLASIPLYINEIISIDRAFGQIEVDGYCIVNSGVPVIRRPEELPIKLLLYILNESGTIYRICSTAVGKRRFLIVGNNLLSNLLFGTAIRKVAREDAEIVCLLDRKTDTVLRGESIERLKQHVFSEIHYVDILKPLECIERINGASRFDLSVNCADITGAETINILATKSGGTVIFANLINNYNIALYITESISRQLDIRCADGYLEAYDEFDFDIVRELIPYIEGAEEAQESVRDDLTHPVGKKSRFLRDSGVRQTIMEDFVCESHAMATVLDEMLTVAKYDCNVLITGETGAGKGKVANMIHKNSNRKMQPFIKVTCASLNAAGMEGELFGIEEGTDQNFPAGKKGMFELADNGTLFLDEIGEMPQDLQAKLLRVIQDGEYFRVGGTSSVKTNVRIISATNRELEDLIDAGLFRRDLYYKLNVVRIRVPALRERTADIPALVEHFLESYGERFSIKRTISRDAVEYLCQCDWPGNTRELENVVQRLMISAGSEEISLIDVMHEMHTDVFDMNVFGGQEAEGGEVNMEVMVDNFEKNIIRHALEKYGSTRKAAKAIGISQTQLVRKKNKYGI
ncbi:MAG: sigma-54-dependent Fis family transcriptional regulator [Firmicutes bacterium]|nr:sigma-54-dependent Fis family transcriptional regulator [Bacillota bacterium]